MNIFKIVQKIDKNFFEQEKMTTSIYTDNPIEDEKKIFLEIITNLILWLIENISKGVYSSILIMERNSESFDQIFALFFPSFIVEYECAECKTNLWAPCREREREREREQAPKCAISILACIHNRRATKASPRPSYSPNNRPS
ncbi:hypothetical protein BpHYR1_027832 [Brachionus plicatilis]|uniref:Uncharacterized protein n=1 Tax=Brachionus plicatilis TaxID=10195 RepID=A0A3M7RI62_BRAPC|nr:hypothetical protein BpHYR1_027832 [Brachionus plicatilis]